MKCLGDTQTHLEALHLAGWIVSPKKCLKHPTQRMTFLGLDVDSARLAFFIPDSKKVPILSQIDRTLAVDWITVLAALYGLLVSVILAVGPSIRLLTRFGFFVINKASSWNQLVLVSEKCKWELAYIKNNLATLDGYSFVAEQPNLEFLAKLANLPLWLSPPIPLAAKAIWKLAGSQGCSGVLVVPKWPLAAFWTTLVPDGTHLAACVQNLMEFYPKYFSWDTVKSRKFRGVKKWPTLAHFLFSDVDSPLDSRYAQSHCLKNGCAFCTSE